MFEVHISIGASASHYWASARYEDSKGTIHERKIEGEQKATVNGNHLEALIQAFGILQTPCMVTVHTESDYIAYAFKNGWVMKWEENGWKNQKGKEVRNVGQWKRLGAAMARHSVRFLLERSAR